MLYFITGDNKSDDRSERVNSAVVDPEQSDGGMTNWMTALKGLKVQLCGINRDMGRVTRQATTLRGLTVMFHSLFRETGVMTVLSVLRDWLTALPISHTGNK